MGCVFGILGVSFSDHELEGRFSYKQSGRVYLEGQILYLIALRVGPWFLV